MSSRPSTSIRSTVLAALALITFFVLGLDPAGAHDSDADSMITVQGGGWGHGVGMSQYGAYGRAVDGQAHQQILEFYYPGATLTKVDVPDDIRVHLHSGTGTVLTPPPGGGSADNVKIFDENGDVIFNSKNGRKLRIRKVPGGFSVTRDNGSGGTNLCIDDDGLDRCQGQEITLKFVQGNPIKLDVIDKVSIGTTGNRYQWGQVVISNRTLDPSGSTLYVVLEELSMDQYIYGLAEVPASWPSEVLRTQAVAGRTYGFDRAASRRASGSWTHPWDLYSTVDDQAYHGFEKETGTYGPTWTAAVDATTREVMLHSGSPITAFYSSSNGGWTEDSGYVFVTSLPYLIAQRDTFDSFQNPNATWSRDYTGSEIGKWFAESSLGPVGDVIDVTVSGNIGESGRLDRASVTVTGTTTTKVVSGNSFRNAINSGVAREGGGLSRQILSTKYTVSVLGGEEPIGAVDTTKRSGNDVTVTGWVFDPDSSNSVEVKVRVDGVIVSTVSADQPRFDIDAVFGEGQQRGFTTTISVSEGVHQVCVYGDNLGPGAKLLLGCKVI